MQNNCYKYEWGKKGKEGTSQDRQKEKGDISEPICFFPVMAPTVQRDLPYSIFPLSSWLVGFPYAEPALLLFSGCSLSPVAPPAFFKHCVPWGEAAEPGQGASMKPRLGRSQLCKAALMKS